MGKQPADGQKAVAGRKPNRLIHESSPYLQQHAYNPVDWYPWGPEALEKARRENKPILLSIGYSACHWCHVMERECFEDEEIAGMMNRWFVNIKVDREERPDLDHIYQTSAQVLANQGGWPLTVFLTPDLRPFYAGTYFPPRDSFGRPGFPRVLRTLHEVYTRNPEKVEQAARHLVEALEKVQAGTGAAPQVPPPHALTQAAEALMAEADPAHGGFGGAPKFPMASALDFLLRSWRREGKQRYLDHVLLSLRKMGAGGIYDQLGGGFHRYSVDAHWGVPHFEKMLYDNACLPPVYLDAYRITGDPLFARIVRETLNYVEREMTHPEGGFYSTQDADSEGVEGKFFVWTPAEVRAVLEPREAELVCAHYGIREGGNFEGGTTVLHVAAPARELAARFKLPLEEVEAVLARARRELFRAREMRIKPFRDEKVLAGWNGLMISAFAKAAQVLGEARYARAARRAVDFLRRHLVRRGAAGDDIRVLRVYKDGPGRQHGFLEDYVFLAQALVDLYETDFDPRDLKEAEALMTAAVELFWDGEDGGFFLTPRDGEDLIQRPKEGWDQSVPSGNGVAAQLMLRLYRFTGEGKWRERAEAILRLWGLEMTRHPLGFGSLLSALDFYHGSVKEIVVAAPKAHPAAENLLRQIQRVYLPNRVLARTDGSAAYPPLAAGKAPGRPAGPQGANGAKEADRTEAVDRAEGAGGAKGADEAAVAVYVCHDFRCERPVHSWDELAPMLQ